MPDMIVHHIDGLLAERITALAKLRQCSVNDVMLDALRNGLGMSVAQQYSESLRDPHALIDEASRVLRPGGRLLAIEPYITPVSYVGYKLLHHEDIWFQDYQKPGE